MIYLWFAYWGKNTRADLNTHGGMMSTVIDLWNLKVLKTQGMYYNYPDNLRKLSCFITTSIGMESFIEIIVLPHTHTLMYPILSNPAKENVHKKMYSEVTSTTIRRQLLTERLPLQVMKNNVKYHSDHI